jgi:DNA-binding transcriptional LysR family regulator
MSSRRALEKIFEDNGVQVNVVMEFDNLETIKRSVEIGAGISIVPVPSIQKEVQSGTLVQVHFTDQTFYRQLGIIVRSKQNLSAAARKFTELMQNPQKAS